MYNPQRFSQSDYHNMYIDLTELSESQVYFTMTQTVVPRPIAWVLSENENGSLNLAPFSYFNAVCSDPPLIMISVGKKPDGSSKDTLVNIEQRSDFVVHIVSRHLLEAMNQTSATLDAGVSELDAVGLATVPMPGTKLPRLADARIAFACERYEIHKIGGVPVILLNDNDQARVVGIVTELDVFRPIADAWAEEQDVGIGV